MDQLIAYGSQFSSEAVKDLSPYQSLSCGQRRCHSTVRSFFYILRIAPYRTTENSIRGLVITIIDSLSALAPPRDQDSARPVKNSPRGTTSGGVFTGRGVPPPGENSLETGGSSVGMGCWRDSAEGAAVGELLRLLLPGLQSLDLYVWSTPFFHAARNLRIQHAACPLDRRFFKPLPGAFPPSGFAEI